METLFLYFIIVMFESDTKCLEHTHTLFAQLRLIITDTERL